MGTDAKSNRNCSLIVVSHFRLLSYKKQCEKLHLYVSFSVYFNVSWKILISTILIGRSSLWAVYTIIDLTSALRLTFIVRWKLKQVGYCQVMFFKIAAASWYLYDLVIKLKHLATQVCRRFMLEISSVESIRYIYRSLSSLSYQPL